MNLLCVVPCGKKKIWDASPDRGPVSALEAYTGSFASTARAYAERFYPEGWIVLSAKYGFLWPTDLVAGPYNVSFSRRRDPVISDFDLREQVERLALNRFNEIVVVAGRGYALAVHRAFADVSGVKIRWPLEGSRSMGSMIAKMKRARAVGLAL
jgi:hypothetical protein